MSNTLADLYSDRPPSAYRRAFLLLILLTVSACQAPFDREAMLADLSSDVLLPAHERLVETAAVLDSEAIAFVATPTLDGLGGLQAAWVAAAIAYKQVEIFEYNEILSLHTAIEKKPINAEFIETFIANEPQLDAAFVESKGSSSKGLGAIEYLIYSPEGLNDQVLASFSEPQRGTYLLGLTANLKARTMRLREHWAADGDNYQQVFIENAAGDADIDSSISTLVNEMIDITENLIKDRLGRPMGINYLYEPSAEMVESPLSGQSLALTIARVESMQAVFNAGIGDYTSHLGGTELTTDIQDQFKIVLRELGTIEQPLQEAIFADFAQVEVAFESTRILLVLIKTDLVNLLGTTITFNDNDGD